MIPNSQAYSQPADQASGHNTQRYRLNRNNSTSKSALAKDRRDFIAVILILSLGYILPRDVVMVVLFAGVILIGKDVRGFSLVQYSSIARLFSFCIAFSLVLGVIVGTANGASYYAVVRDIFYFLKVYVSILFGIVIAFRFSEKEILKLVLYCGAAVSLIYALKTVINLNLFLESRELFRRQVGYGYDASVVGLLLLITLSRHVDIGRRKKLALFILLLIGVALPMSRSYWAVMGGLALAYYIDRFVNRHFSYFLCLLLFGMQILFSTSLVVQLAGDAQVRQWLESAPRSLIELVPLEYNAREDVVEFYRAYEANLTFNYVSQNGELAEVVGMGFGSEAPLKDSTRLLSDDGITSVSITHNAFAHFFLKLGLVGVIIYCVTLLELTRKLLKTTRSSKVLHVFMICVTIPILLGSPTATGWLNPNTWLNIFLYGVVIGKMDFYRTTRKKRNAQHEGFNRNNLL